MKDKEQKIDDLLSALRSEVDTLKYLNPTRDKEYLKLRLLEIEEATSRIKNAVLREYEDE